MKFAEMMALDRRRADSFVGHGPRYPWGGLFGGQIVAQSLVAAAATGDGTHLATVAQEVLLRPAEQP